MTVEIKHRRYGTTVRVDEKLGAALVKHGSHAYVEAPPVPAPAPAPAAPRQPSAQSTQPASPPPSGSSSKSAKAGKAKGARKGSYNRRDMQAKG
jgi:hypothetical protein